MRPHQIDLLATEKPLIEVVRLRTADRGDHENTGTSLHSLANCQSRLGHLVGAQSRRETVGEK